MGLACFFTQAEKLYNALYRVACLIFKEPE